jgi:signal transduction histidine kinase
VETHGRETGKSASSRWPAYKDRREEAYILPCPLPELADIIDEKSSLLVSMTTERTGRSAGRRQRDVVGGAGRLSSYISSLSDSLRKGDLEPFLDYQLEEARRYAREGVPLEEVERWISSIRESLRGVLLKSAKSPDQVLAFTLSSRVLESLIDASSTLVARHYILTREEELKAKELQLELLSRRLLTVQEEERKRLATDLHDELIQLLFGLRYELDVVKGRLGEGQAVDRELMTMKSRIDQGLTELRRILRNLRPALLDDLGLVSALKLLVRQANESSGNRVTLESSEDADRLPTEIETCLYRVAQEALTNAVKHSRAQKISATLYIDDGEVVLRVSDNGIGFDVASQYRDNRFVTGEGFGLYGMRERLRGLNARLTVESEAGVGTRVTAVLPAYTEPREADR